MSAFIMQTSDGVVWDLNTDAPQRITPHTLARVLSRIPRYVGHTFTPYSVAEHSLLVQYLAVSLAMARQIPIVREVHLAAMVHDAHEAITGDMVLLFPGFAADNQDITAIFWDASANEISRKLYDDSANTWGETSISTGMADQVATTAFPHFDGFVDIANSRIVLVAWNGVDTASADLLGWTVTESAITAFTTPVVSNGTDDQGLCAITLDTVTGDWYCFYGGKSDGSETFLTSINIYYKVSQDDGATWGPETQLTNTARDTTWLVATPRWATHFTVAFPNDIAIDELMASAPIMQPRATFALGI